MSNYEIYTPMKKYQIPVCEALSSFPFVNDIPPIFFLKLIHNILQFAGLLGSYVPQAELAYRRSDSADADSDKPDSLIRLADGVQ